MIGSPGQALSAFSASARKPSVRAGLAKTWARVLAHVSGSASGSGFSTSVLAGWSGIETLSCRDSRTVASDGGTRQDALSGHGVIARASTSFFAHPEGRPPGEIGV